MVVSVDPINFAISLPFPEMYEIFDPYRVGHILG